MNIDPRYLSVGGVSLHVNRNANMWSSASMNLSKLTKSLKSNYDDDIPLQVIVVYIVPGFENPVNFSGTRITIKSKKNPQIVQVEAAIPDIPFPLDSPNDAKDVFLELMAKAIEEVKTYLESQRISTTDLNGVRNILKELREQWDLSKFNYKIPPNLPLYDMPSDEKTITRVFVEKLKNGGERHYNMLIDKKGKEIV